MPITPFTDRDIPLLHSIETAASPEAPWSDEIFRRCFYTGAYCWGISAANGALAGFIMGTLLALPATATHAASGESHILNLAVHPAYQRQGMGRTLLAYFIDQARTQHIASIFLEVRASNKKAIQLYQSMGFVEISIRKNYYPHPALGREDAIMYALELI